MANVKVLKLGLKVSSDTTLVSVSWCGSQPTLRVWLTFNSSTDVWNVICFEEWMSKGVTMVGLCLVLDWSSQTGVVREWCQWICLLSGEPRWSWRLETFCLLWCGGEKTHRTNPTGFIVPSILPPALWCGIYPSELLILLLWDGGVDTYISNVWVHRFFCVLYVIKSSMCVVQIIHTWSLKALGQLVLGAWYPPQIGL